MIAGLQAVLESRELACTLLHSLWLGALLAGGLWWALRRLPAGQAQRRYALSVTALGLLVAGTMTIGAVLSYWPEAASAAAPPATASVECDQAFAANRESIHIPPPTEHGPGGGEPLLDDQWVGPVVAGWMVGVSLMLLRVVAMLGFSRSLRRGGLRCEDPALLGLLEEARQLAGVTRRVGLRLHRTVASPAVVGILKPVVLLPVSAATGLSPDQLRVVLLHELAHIRRYDLLVQVGQLLAEALLFFNPGVWWISRQISQEREACADALAVRHAGQPARYVEMLVGWAVGGAGRETWPTATAMGLARFSLLDRARRLLDPGHRPDVRLPWPQILLMAVLTALVLVGLWQGAALSVKLAAHLLSPKERVYLLVNADERHGPIVPPRTPPHANEATIVGKVRSADGRPLGDLRLTTYSRTEQSSTHASYDTDSEGRFEFGVAPGALWVVSIADGYAPSWIGPLRAEPKARLESLEIILPPGYQAQARFVDENGAAIAGVQVTAQVLIDTFTAYAGTFRSGPDGRVVFGHLRDSPYDLRAKREGYEPSERKNVRLASGETLTWALQKAQPLVGLVVDEAGQPVAGATMRLFGTEDGSVPGPHGEVLATTDPQGRFEATSLEAGRGHVLYIEHPEVGRTMVLDVRPSLEPLRIVLVSRTVRGRVIGDLSRLACGPDGRPEVGYGVSVTYQPNETYNYGLGKAPVEVREGVGYFELARLPQGTVSVAAGGITKQQRITDEPAPEIVIDLNSPPPPKRTVILRLAPPAGQPQVTGWVDIQSFLSGVPPVVERMQVTDGEAAVDAYAGGSFSYRSHRLVGAWLPEGRLDEPVPAGDQPLVLERQTYPAGAIVGRVVDRQPAPRHQIHVRVHGKRMPPPPEPQLEQPMHSAVSEVSVEASPLDESFMLTPLPLGGVYRAVASRGRYYAVSDPVTVDAASPLPEVELQMGLGVTMAVQVFGPDGRSLADVPVEFRYELHGAGNGGAGGPVMSDAQGLARFEGVNPEAGRYYGVIDLRRDYQPIRAQLGPAEDPPMVQLERGQVVEGRVIDVATGWPVPDAEVYAVNGGGEAASIRIHEAEALTDREGRFRISTLPAGRCDLGVRSANFDGRQPSVAAGNGEPVTLRVKLPEWSSLRPRRPGGPGE